MAAQFLAISLARGLRLKRRDWTPFHQRHWPRSVSILKRLLGDTEPSGDLTLGLYVMRCYELFYTRLPPSDMQSRIGDIIAEDLGPLPEDGLRATVEGARFALLMLQISQRSYGSLPPEGVTETLDQVTKSLEEMLTDSQMCSQFPEVRSFYNALLEAHNNTEVSASTEYKFLQAILPGASIAIPSGSSRLRVSSGESPRAELMSLLSSVHGDISREIEIINELFDSALQENDIEQAVMHDTRIKELTRNSNITKSDEATQTPDTEEQSNT
ncbi:hypothetical protein BKA65DRAFT_580875 [Rhexocercosporidium sp. MPI-PUGE-AT-0058]|nr:hypothetical protein BKA65DRAFT_580875 [Rhexocercosporidium sp. MPI-PUGE-AT-0058]